MFEKRSEKIIYSSCNMGKFVIVLFYIEVFLEIKIDKLIYLDTSFVCEASIFDSCAVWR